ncbi:COG1361 family protein [Halodesulfurarchaeum formicicum]|uniref:hypothetical protein n=1 Tax=Halodesulfurarchaeum formicicum TaxID=1873524 RepID=UPI000903DA0A|nr:hypothetical protein [Halodesulfurarchaeum formicicum]
MRSRSVTGLLTLVLIIAAVTVAVPASGSISNLAIESATPTVEDPAPGERFSVSVTIANYDDMAAFEVTDVYIRDAGRANEHARVEDVGTVRPGGSLTVPISLSFEDSGTRDLRVHTRVENESGDHRSVSYPLTIDVEPPDEAVLRIDDIDAVAGQEEQVNVTVSNGEDRPLSNVRLELGGDAIVDNAERVTASLGAGTQAVHRYDLTFAESGSQTVTGTVTYRTADGQTRSVDRSMTVDVEPARTDPELTLTPIQSPDGPALEATLVQYGNAELRDVELRAVRNGRILARSVLDDVPATESRTATFDGATLGSGNLTVVASYTASGTDRTIEASRDYQPTDTAAITLSGVEVTREGTIVTLRGDAANVGSNDLESVRVAVEPAAGVSPSSPSRDYFIGGIEASEFGTFELTANVTDSAGSVPIRVAYSAGGEQFETREFVELDDGAGDSDAEDQSGTGGLGLLRLGIVGLVGALIGAALYRWRT